MVLVDTSVWINYFRKISTKGVTKLEELLDRKRPFYITGVIYQELLQGATSQKDFQRLLEYFSTQIFAYVRDPVASYSNAALIYQQCRGKGFTIRSTVDCLIAQIAIEHQLSLLHDDKDFDSIAKVSKLKIY